MRTPTKLFHRGGRDIWLASSSWLIGSEALVNDAEDSWEGRAWRGSCGRRGGGERTLVERLALEEESKARGRRLGYVIQGRRTDNPITKKDIIPFKSHRKIQIALHNESYKRKRFNDISEPRPKARKIAFRPGILGGKHNAITFSRIL